MKFVESSGFADPDVAARKLVEIANAVEMVNGAFLKAGGTPNQYRAALERTISLGWLSLHKSGTYVKFTPAGAELFA